MNIDQLIIKIKNLQANSLLGWEAQKLMSPSYRGDLDIEKIHHLNPKLGAVAIVLYLKDNELHFILTQRQDYDGTHSGQISFPGGKKEADESNLETAIRETFEEIGVHLSKDDFCGALSSIYIPPSHFLVSPQVFYLEHLIGFNLDEYEVKEVIEIPLINLFKPEHKTNVDLNTSQGFIKNIPAYNLNDKIVWGATAIILSELEQVLLKTSIK